MNIIKLLLFCLIFNISFNLIAEEKEEITKEELLQRIELLEVEIETLKIETTDNNPVTNGSTINWGQGFAINIGLYNNVKYFFYDRDFHNVDNGMIDLSFMYYIPINNKKIISSEKTKANKTGSKIGLGLSFLISSEKYYSSWSEDINQFYIGPKFSWASQISSNLMSFTFYVSPLIHIDLNQITLTTGSQLELWISKNIKLFFGPNFSFDFNRHYIKDQLLNIDLPYAEMLLGMSYYF